MQWIGWLPETKFSDGIGKNIAWHLENKEGGGNHFSRVSELLRADVWESVMCVEVLPDY